MRRAITGPQVTRATLAGPATALALVLTAPLPAAAGPADATCVYLALGCAPDLPAYASDETAPPSTETESPSPRPHHRPHRMRRHRSSGHVESRF